MAAPETMIGGGFAKAALTLALALCAACGGAPPAADWPDLDPETGAKRPNPTVANPCEAPAIDPALNPCVGSEAPAAAAAKPASTPTPADAPTPDDAANPEDAPTP